MNQIGRYLKEEMKKLFGLMKDELGGKIMNKFVGLRAETHSYLTVDGNGHKKAKGTKKCLIKKKNLKIIKTVQKQLNMIVKKISRTEQN